MNLRSCAAAALYLIVAGAPAWAKNALPLFFEPTVASDTAVAFVRRAPDHTLLLGRDRLALVSDDGRSAVRLRFPGATAGAPPVGLDPLPGVSHYFLGREPNAWRHGVPHFAAVETRELYPGIDVVYHAADDGSLEYDFRVAPRADPTQIEIAVEQPARARVDSNGSLRVTAPGLALEQRLRVYQGEGAARREVQARFRAHGRGRFGVALGAYDRTRPLVIDPVLCFSTYLGGSDQDYITGSALDSTGNIYVAGTTYSSSFPTLAPLQAAFGGGKNDVFVAKLDPSGTLRFATYIGGAGDDSTWNQALALAPSGAILVTGETGSLNFPVVNPLQAMSAGGSDAFVLALDPTGSTLLFSTYLGSGNVDYGRAITSDPAGNVFITGTTRAGFPVTPGAFQTVFTGFALDGFVVKIAADWTRILYATYLGGSGTDVPYSIAVDAAGSAVVAGYTDSPDFPMRRPLQAANKGKSDAFVSTLTRDGSDLEFSTYLGGSQIDGASGVWIDPAGRIDVSGYTQSTDFPLRNPLQAAYGGGTSDGFVARIDPAGPTLLFSTYLGGSGEDIVISFADGPGGTTYIAGVTSSPDFPVVKPLQALYAGGDDDGFIALLSADGSRLLLSTYLGGSLWDHSDRIAVSPDGAVYVASLTSSLDFPFLNAAQPAYGGGRCDGYVTKVDCWIAADAGAGVSVCPGATATLDGSASAGCATGLQYRWLDGSGTPVCGWSPIPSCVVTPTAATTYTLEVTCQSCATCADSAMVTVVVKADPVPPDQGNLLLGTKQGNDVRLDFPGALATLWRLYRDPDKRQLGTTAVVPDVATTSFTDVGAVPSPPTSDFYRLKGLSPCSLTPGP